MRIVVRTLLMGGVVAGLLLAGCAAVRQIPPMDPGENAISLSLGGPMTRYIGDAYAPLLFLSLGYSRGLHRVLDIEAGLDLTHMLYGVGKVDVGLNWRPFQAERWRPALIVSPKFHFATDFSTGARLYPALSITGAWHVRKFYPYLGLENFFELQQERADGLEQEHHWLILPYVGLVLEHKRWQYQFEMKVYTVNLDNDYGRPPDNWGFGEHGIIGFFLAFSRTFGGNSE
jgi:hypothetical protein